MGAPTPSVIVEPFGAEAGGSYITDPIPVPPTGTNSASFHDGFPPVTMTPVGAGGQDFLGPDLNGILYMITAYLQALTGGQFWQYNSSWSAANSGYNVGAVLAMAAGNGFWINETADNTSNPDTAAAATSGWAPLVCYGVSSITGLTAGTVTLTAPQAACFEIELTGTLSGNISLVLPPWVKKWRIVNKTTGGTATAILVSVTGGVNTLVVPQFGTTGYTDVYSDGTDLYLEGYWAEGYFTATLTGCSTSPTQQIQYRVNGRTCMLSLPGGISGTSNADTMTLTGLPGFLDIYPTVAATAQPVNLQVGGTWTLGTAQITTGLVIQFSMGAVSGTAVQYSPTVFPTSGTKGVTAWQMIYPYGP